MWFINLTGGLNRSENNLIDKENEFSANHGNKSKGVRPLQKLFG